MNPTLKKLLEAAEGWTSDEPAELAGYARMIEARRSGIYRLDADELAAIVQGLEQADQGVFAADEAVSELFRRFGA